MTDRIVEEHYVGSFALSTIIFLLKSFIEYIFAKSDAIKFLRCYFARSSTIAFLSLHIVIIIVHKATLFSYNPSRRCCRHQRSRIFNAEDGNAPFRRAVYRASFASAGSSVLCETSKLNSKSSDVACLIYPPEWRWVLPLHKATRYTTGTLIPAVDMRLMLPVWLTMYLVVGKRLVWTPCSYFGHPGSLPSRLPRTSTKFSSRWTLRAQRLLKTWDSPEVSFRAWILRLLIVSRICLKIRIVKIIKQRNVFINFLRKLQILLYSHFLLL